MRSKKITKLAILGALSKRQHFKWIPDKTFVKIEYRFAFQKKLSLENPTTFNEKIQWLKLYNRKPEYTIMADKYAVRDYIAKTIGKEYSIPLVGGPWEDVDQINFDELPNQFVLKCNHDSGGYVICKDKSKLDIEAAKRKLKKHLKRNYFWANREWPYKNIKPCVIAEKFMVDESGYELKDYKVFCFNGVPEIMFIATDRGVDTRFDFFDMEFNRLPFTNSYPPSEKEVVKPKSFEEMKMLAQKLSANIPLLRVDFYEINGKVYIGELTFFHGSGFIKFKPDEWDKRLGDKIILPQKSE